MTKADLLRDNERMRKALEDIEASANAAKPGVTDPTNENVWCAIGAIRVEASLGLRGYIAKETGAAS